VGDNGEIRAMDVWTMSKGEWDGWSTENQKDPQHEATHAARQNTTRDVISTVPSYGDAYGSGAMGPRWREKPEKTEEKRKRSQRDPKEG
jgi:hypothetical protein